MRNRLPIALSVAALVVALLGAVPVAQSHGVLHALFAHRAGAVDGKSAVSAGVTLNRAAGKLVATRARGVDRGKFASKFIPKVDDSTKLEGQTLGSVLDLANKVVGFANISSAAGGTPTVRSFGGQGTTAASVVREPGGGYDVTFTGNYPGLSSRDQLSTFATADTDFFDFASTSLNASPEPTSTQITIRIFTITTNVSPPLVVANRDFAVQVLVP